MTGEGISALVVAGIAVLSVVYQAGAISNRFAESRQMAEEEHKRLRSESEQEDKRLRKEFQDDIAQIRKDVNAIGCKVNKNQEDAARQFHNMNAVMILTAAREKQAEVVGFLREEKT